MLLFTDLHYRSCALRTGNPAWPGPRGRLGVVAASVPALVSKRWARRELRRVEADFATAAARLAAASNGAAAPPVSAREPSPASREVGAVARP
jgi:hypothetical protein